jgi:hypothetical protein
MTVREGTRSCVASVRLHHNSSSCVAHTSYILPASVFLFQFLSSYFSFTVR